jgi:hypothetical protein
MDEVWGEIEGFPNYVISNYGEIINIKFNRSLKPRSNSRGYSHVILFNGGIRKEFYVHQLVAVVFLGGYRTGMHVQHSDGNKNNNHVSNLRLRGRRSTDIEYEPSHIKGRRVRIIETGEIFLNAYTCAKYINGHASNIYACLRGKYKTHMGYTFEYYDEEVQHVNQSILASA